MGKEELCKVCRQMLRSEIERSFQLCTMHLAQLPHGEEEDPQLDDLDLKITESPSVQVDDVTGKKRRAVDKAQSLFKGPLEVQHCTRISRAMNEMFIKRVQLLSTSPSEYIRKLIEADLKRS